MFYVVVIILFLKGKRVDGYLGAVKFFFFSNCFSFGYVYVCGMGDRNIGKKVFREICDLEVFLKGIVF